MAGDSLPGSLDYVLLFLACQLPSGTRVGHALTVPRTESLGDSQSWSDIGDYLASVLPTHTSHTADL